MTQVVAFSFVFLISRLFSCLPDGSQEVMLQGSQGSLNSWGRGLLLQPPSQRQWGAYPVC